MLLYCRLCYKHFTWLSEELDRSPVVNPLSVNPSGTRKAYNEEVNCAELQVTSRNMDEAEGDSEMHVRGDRRHC